MATIKLNGYEICIVLQALQEADLQWDRRITDAEDGHHSPNFDIVGAKLCRKDLRGVIAQLKDQDPFTWFKTYSDTVGEQFKLN